MSGRVYTLDGREVVSSDGHRRVSRHFLLEQFNRLLDMYNLVDGDIPPETLTEVASHLASWSGKLAWYARQAAEIERGPCLLCNACPCNRWHARTVWRSGSEEWLLERKTRRAMRARSLVTGKLRYPRGIPFAWTFVRFADAGPRTEPSLLSPPELVR